MQTSFAIAGKKNLTVLPAAKPFRIQALCNASIVLSMAGLALGLVACERGLDTRDIADRIQNQIINEGGISLKSVVCPKQIKPAAGGKFQCVGELDAGTKFAINVTQQDTEGDVIWDFAHTKGLLNLEKLEVDFKEALKRETGEEIKVDCRNDPGRSYRSVKPGDSFECLLAAAKDKPGKKKQPDNRPNRLLVTIDSERNVSWQQLLPEVATKPGSDSAKQSEPAIANNDSDGGSADAQTADSETVPLAETSASPPPQTAEDALNSGDNNFED